MGEAAARAPPPGRRRQERRRRAPPALPGHAADEAEDSGVDGWQECCRSPRSSASRSRIHCWPRRSRCPFTSWAPSHPGTRRNLYGMNDRLVWIDCEMTGLDIETDALIEVACLVTDPELRLLDDGIDLIIKPPAEALDQMKDVVRSMHTKSGLLADLSGGASLAEAQRGRAELRQAARRRAAQGAAVRQLDRDRPLVPRPRHAGAGRLPALPDDRRVRRSRSWRAAGTRGRTSPRPPSTAGTARSPTSPRACRSCGTTGRRSSSRSRGRTQPTAREIAARYANQQPRAE